MNNPKVSILIPLYNSEKYIAETIDSCLSQTYENVEIIIVDDGSTDSGLDIARQYEKKYENIKVETQKNSGAPAARNRAFELSIGEYIQYIDADDLLHPDKIRLQMEALIKADDGTLAFGRWGTFRKSIKNVIWNDIVVNKNYDDSKQFLIDLWSSGQAAITHLWLVPRVLVKESGGWNESLVKNQDGEFFARVVFQANRILFIKDSLGYYRKDNENSISKQISKKALQSNLKTFETYAELMKDDMDKPEVRRSLALVHSRFLHKIPPSYKDIIAETKNRINRLGFDKPLQTLKGYNFLLAYIFGQYRVDQLKKIVKRVMVGIS
jgi:glycosyltransferase involved in cell wall biosynthesis